MGAQYQNVGIYIDGILVPSPFHGMDITQGATLSIFTSEVLENIELLPAAYPEKYGDDVGAALELDTRDGSRTAPVFSHLCRIGRFGSGRGRAAGNAQTRFVAGFRAQELSRLSFSQQVERYIVRCVVLRCGLKLNYDIAPNQRVDFYGVGGPASYKLVHPSTAPAPNDIDGVTEEFMMGRIGWRWAVDPRLLVEAHGAHLLEPSTESNFDGQPLDNAHYKEWVAAGAWFRSGIKTRRSKADGWRAA